jgi:hypothetical protein
MTSKSGVSVACFFVVSQCRDPTNWTKDIPLGSKTVEHNVDVENGSTLPYDVTVQTTLPHPGDIEFAYRGGAVRSDWEADIQQLASLDAQKDYAVIHCIATRPGQVRINSPTIKYRLDSTHAWIADPTNPLLTIQMNIR